MKIKVYRRPTQATDTPSPSGRWESLEVTEAEALAEVSQAIVVMPVLHHKDLRGLQQVVQTNGKALDIIAQVSEDASPELIAECWACGAAAVTRVDVFNDWLDTPKPTAYTLSAAQETFLDQFCHEFRNPLHAIIGYAEILQSDPLQPSQIQNLQYMRRSGLSLLRIVERLTLLASLREGRIRSAPKAIHLRTFATQVLHQVRETFPSNNFHLSLDTSLEKPFSVLLDQQLASAALRELLFNAIVHGEAPLELAISQATTSQGDYLKFQVSDHGPGLPEALRTLAAQPFVQFAAPGKLRMGLGLGLTLATELSLLLGGALEFRTNGQPPFAVTLRLPLQEVSQIQS